MQVGLRMGMLSSRLSCTATLTLKSITDEPRIVKVQISGACNPSCHLVALDSQPFPSCAPRLGRLLHELLEPAKRNEQDRHTVTESESFWHRKLVRVQRSGSLGNQEQETPGAWTAIDHVPQKPATVERDYAVGHSDFVCTSHRTRVQKGFHHATLPLYGYTNCMHNRPGLVPFLGDPIDRWRSGMASWCFTDCGSQSKHPEGTSSPQGCTARQCAKDGSGPCLSYFRARTGLSCRERIAN
ncbi:hypothetical protein V8F06_004134 [Rhypophila decipiens]